MNERGGFGGGEGRGGEVGAYVFPLCFQVFQSFPKFFQVFSELFFVSSFLVPLPFAGGYERAIRTHFFLFFCSKQKHLSDGSTFHVLFFGIHGEYSSAIRFVLLEKRVDRPAQTLHATCRAEGGEESKDKTLVEQKHPCERRKPKTRGVKEEEQTMTRHEKNGTTMRQAKLK